MTKKNIDLSNISITELRRKKMEFFSILGRIRMHFSRKWIRIKMKWIRYTVTDRKYLFQYFTGPLQELNKILEIFSFPVFSTL